MEQDVLIALLSLAGTLTGTLGGILTSARLTNYRIEQLEKKVEPSQRLRRAHPGPGGSGHGDLAQNGLPGRGEDMKDRLSALLTVKSLVTVTLTGVFAALALQRCVSAQEFLTVFTVVISFYFGTQHERSNAA